MGCGSSTATRTGAAQPAPKPKQTSSHSIKEINGHAHRRKESEQSETSSKQQRGKETPSSEANGHLPNPNVETAYNNTVSETHGDNVERGPGDRSANESPNCETKTNENSSPESKETRSLQEQVYRDIPAHNTSQSKVTEEEARPVVNTSSSAVDNDSVPMETSGDVEKPEVNQETGVTEAQEGGDAEIDLAQHRAPNKASLSGEADLVPHTDASENSKGTVASNEANENSASGETETSQGKSSGNGNLSDPRRTSRTSLSNHNGASEASLSSKKDTISHSISNTVQTSNRVTSQVSFSSNKDIPCGQDRDQRNGSMTVSEFFNAPSEASLSGRKDSVPPSNTNAVQASNRDTSHVSLSSNKDTASGQDECQRKASMTVSEFFGAPSDAELHLSNQSLGSSQQNVLPSSTEAEQRDEPNEIVTKESVSEDIPASDKNIETSTSADPFSTKRDSSMSTDTDPDRICTVTANVKIGSIEHTSGHKTVNLTGSVYRLPRADDSATPKPGDKIGIVKGDVTSNPADYETSEKIAILRGDLFAVSGEDAANGLIATASIDVLSCNLREKIATITADVAPSDDPEHQTGVISGEVLAASERGSYDDKIGSLSGKVVALTFGEGVTSLASVNR